MGRLLKKIPIHAVQGSREDTEYLEYALAQLGYQVRECFNYDLMSLDQGPTALSLAAGPPELTLVTPGILNVDDLFPLQAAYEQEEVLPRGAVFNGEYSLKSLKQLVLREQILTACLNGRIVGKINTNAESFSRFQIGGVYVCPEFRGQGIATRMTAAISRNLIAQGKAVSLFVKKRNIAAQTAYRRAGFTVSGDYRICYY
jgi:ribosomal protein S18 acetylase RimI-like enzyme